MLFLSVQRIKEASTHLLCVPKGGGHHSIRTDTQIKSYAPPQISSYVQKHRCKAQGEECNNRSTYAHFHTRSTLHSYKKKKNGVSSGKLWHIRHQQHEWADVWGHLCNKDSSSCETRTLTQSNCNTVSTRYMRKTRQLWCAASKANTETGI